MPHARGVQKVAGIARDASAVTVAQKCCCGRSGGVDGSKSRRKKVVRNPAYYSALMCRNCGQFVRPNGFNQSSSAFSKAGQGDG